VLYDPELKNISDSRGIWRWKKIVVGPSFLRLDEREAGAVLLHEAGHCKLRHLEKRLTMLWLVLVSPKRLLRICLEQEYEADRFAAKCGYGNDLIRLFNRMSAQSPGPFHPELGSRIARLMQ
jgi:Zn-dependent protease with chaperone function